MTSAASGCYDLEEIFEVPEDTGNYRYFNQPTEQIPGWEQHKPQILIHRPDSGLQWATLDQCLDVVTCLKLESDKLKVERRNIVIIKDFEIEEDEECDIEVTDCEEETGP